MVIVFPGERLRLFISDRFHRSWRASEPLVNSNCRIPAKDAKNFGCISFDVRGVIQLYGNIIKSAGGKSPEDAKGIRVTLKCERLYFLQGVGS